MMRADLRRFGLALRAFLQGFVGATPLPTDRKKAKAEIEHRCETRGRCC
ncbi:MAG: hypothetical protein R3F35_04365 [Myxococcota bacterium]